MRAVGRAGLARRLRELDGSNGRTHYADGQVRIEHGDEVWTVRPPFPLVHDATYDRVEAGPLLAVLEADRLVAVVLVRLGGFAIGVLEGERVVASKVGQRLVHGRHRAGGWSQRRFSRRRDDEARALYEKAGREAERVLTPWLGRVDAAAFGGDRAAVRAALASVPSLARLEALALPRFHAVPDPRRATLDTIGFAIYSADLEVEPATPEA